MKKLIAGVLVLTILGSCGNKKTNIDPFASITQEVDSIPVSYTHLRAHET